MKYVMKKFEDIALLNTIKRDPKTAHTKTEVGVENEYKFVKFSEKETASVISVMIYVWLMVHRFHLMSWLVEKVRYWQTEVDMKGLHQQKSKMLSLKEEQRYVDKNLNIVVTVCRNILKIYRK